MSFITLLFLVLIYLPLAILMHWIIKSIFDEFSTKGKRKTSLIIGLFLLLMPTWDIILGGAIISYKCTGDRSLKIFKTVEVDGIFLYRPSTYDVKPHNLGDYKYLEYGIGNKHEGKIYNRAFLNKNGEVEIIKVTELLSKYEYSEPLIFETKEIIGRELGGTKYFISEIESGEIIAQFINYKVEAGWIDKSIFGRDTKYSCMALFGNSPAKMTRLTLNKKNQDKVLSLE